MNELIDNNNDKLKNNKIYDIIFLPNFLIYLQYNEIVNIKLIAKYFFHILSDNLDYDPYYYALYWKSITQSYANYYGLYLPNYIVNYKHYFFKELYNNNIKYKWNNDIINQDNKSFNIKVSCRFRPGDHIDKNITLPLHQFLKVRRLQQNKIDSNNDSSTKNPIYVGEEDPIEFIDPFLNILMKDPVLLLSSNRIVDRSVALQCILRGGRDPFNNNKLIQSMLVPQIELKDRINEWRRKKEQIDISIAIKDVKPLIDESSVNPELLDALIDIDRLSQIARKAQFEAMNSLQSNIENDDISDINEENNNVPEITEENETTENDTTNNNTAIEILPVNIEPADIIPESNYDDISSDLDKFRTKSNESTRVIDISPSNASVTMNVPGLGVRPFQFMSVHNENANQIEVYNSCARDMVVATINGYNACVLCYGQTGSGKTHTFFGPDNFLNYNINISNDEIIIPNNVGIVLRACIDALQSKQVLELQGINVSLSAQFIEIYDESVTDLLSGQLCQIKRENGEVVGAIDSDINSLNDIMSILKTGHARKRFAATAMNDRSSRSHTAFILQITQTRMIQSNETKVIKSHLHLIDLAGSERIKKSQVVGQQLSEAITINSSLLVLGKCINNLINNNSHVPYFESKLTILLKNSFGGNCKTNCIINCHLSDRFSDETLHSLRFGERCSMISNTIKVNAKSFDLTMNNMNSIISNLEKQISVLAVKKKTSLPCYSKLVQSYEMIKRKRDILLSTMSKPIKSSAVNV